MKIVFLLASIYDSHHIRRCQSFREEGYDIDIYGYDRGINLPNILQSSSHIIGHIKNQKYFSRIKTVSLGIKRVIRIYPKNTLFYATTFDIAFICMCMKCKYIYEISDITHSNFIFLIRTLFKVIDKYIIKRSFCTVLTSEGFIPYLNTDYRQQSKLIMLPNKLSSYFLNIERPYPLKVSGKLKIGFIGYFRYPNTVLRFARLIGEYFPNIEFHFFGTGEEIILNRVNSLSSRYSNIFNNGPFVNPTDLPQIYNSIDLVACNYDTSTINERIAEPNKLYEAIFFNKPLIVSSNTYLASKVKQLQCGYIIDSSNDKDIIEFLESITADSIYSIAMNESMIQKTDIMESCVELFEKIHVYDI